MKTQAIILAFVACAHLTLAIPLGISKLGFGFDVAKGKAKAPVAQLTYSGAKWYNPFTETNTDVPDEVYISTDAYFSYDLSVYSSYSEYANAYATESCVDEYWSEYAYSDTEAASSWEGFFEMEGCSLVDVSSYTYLYTVGLFPSCDTDNGTNAMIQRAESKLPESLESSESLAAYTKFIDTYGTHVVVEVSYGGEAHFFSFMNTSAMGASSAYEAISLLSNSYDNGDYSDTFSGSFSFGEYFGTETVYYETFSYSGGFYESITTDPSDNSTSSNWMSTIKQAPAAVSYKLKPISEFLPTKGANMEKALIMYAQSKK